LVLILGNSDAIERAILQRGIHEAHWKIQESNLKIDVPVFARKLQPGIKLVRIEYQ
jgi:hypothetical protein